VHDLLHLAEPVDSQTSCGIDCEYEVDFLSLSQAVNGKPEQQFGDTVIPAVEPEWRLVERMAVELFARTKDLRVAAWLTLAVTHLYGVQGFAAGAALIYQLCERYWDDVHPRLVIDGEDDPFLRMNALGSLSDGGGSYSGGSEILRALRNALVVSRAVSVSVRDIEMGVSNDSAARYSADQIQSILVDALSDGTEVIDALEDAALSVNSLCELIEARVAYADQPDFAALKSLFRSLSGAVTRAKSFGSGQSIATEQLEPGSPQGGVTDGSDGARPVVSISAPGEIRSRDDVRKTLQRVADYLGKNEPSTPALLFVRRAERMLGMGFLDLMYELSPDSMHQLQVITGAQREDNAS